MMMATSASEYPKRTSQTYKTPFLLQAINQTLTNEAQ